MLLAHAGWFATSAVMLVLLLAERRHARRRYIAARLRPY
jgi:hypothetical protein